MARTVDGWDVETFPEFPGMVRLKKDERFIVTQVEPGMSEDEAIHRSLLAAAVNDYERMTGKRYDPDNIDRRGATLHSQIQHRLVDSRAFGLARADARGRENS